MGKAQRRKGGEGERELVRYLRDLLGEDVARNLDQVRDGGGDILLSRWSIEAKRAKQASLGPWWAQAVEQGEPLGYWPALAYRLDHQSWRVRVPLVALTDAAGPLDALEWTAELSLAGFAAVVIEGMGCFQMHA